ncbi:MAG: TlpA family protein disulfide reductase [Muribaculaceae bacterium]|nr:TlpA family protein disulfide reductase [Muribaculaceae bacterium]
MKKILFGIATSLMLAACSSDKGEVTIRLPKDFKDSTLVVTHITIDNTVKAKSADDLVIKYDTLAVKDGQAVLKLDKAGAAWYNINPPVMTRMQPEFYAMPEDNLTVDITKFDPLAYTVTGSPLMEDITAFRAETQPVRMEYFNLISTSDYVDPEKANAMLNRYDEAVKKFVADHPDSQAIPYAIQELSGDDFKKIYDNMSPEAKKSILMPYADLYNQEVEKMIKERDAEQARKDEIASGKQDAPNFTLPDLQGKMVSLSDFRGKWVVLDFWGSWCGWCVKGFPALKEAYQKYGDKIVVIGIDCNESETDWKAGVKKHEIPWLNLYNGNDRTLYEAYGITGFPTKAIINPEGKLVNLTTGEDPTFYDQLAAFVK